LDQARASGIALIRNFAFQLRQDILAVEAAVTEKWSNGPVEGQVNRLKTIKRQMYGRPGLSCCALGLFRRNLLFCNTNESEPQT